jgi:hypothetical protein
LPQSNSRRTEETPMVAVMRRIIRTESTGEPDRALLIFLHETPTTHVDNTETSTIGVRPSSADSLPHVNQLLSATKQAVRGCVYEAALLLFVGRVKKHRRD